MRAGRANTDGSFTRIHWAFAEIDTSDRSVKIRDYYKQWDKFKNVLNSKKIISPKFSKNIAKFLSDESLDGVDFDREYPEAMDIDGTPPDLPSDGPHYLKFLDYDPTNAAGWEIAVDCSTGLVLDNGMLEILGRLKAARQETACGAMATYTLAMITKAGVPTNKIIVGESSYGRTFKMSQAGCTGPMCTFEGDRLKINDIIDLHLNVKTWHDGASNSDMVVYDDTEWVAYMSDTTKDPRRSHWKGLNFICKKFINDDYSSDVLDPAPEPEKLPFAGFAGHPRHSLSRYDIMMADGYDGKFNTYAGAVVQGSTKVVDEFMLDKGNKSFGCIVTETITCCNYCLDMWREKEYTDGEPPECRYRNISQACPPNCSQRAEMPPAKGLRYTQSVYCTLHDDKAEQFWADLYSETGATQDDITWENVHHFGCAPTDKHCRDQNWDYNFPVPRVISGRM
ncbi:uncharacterized protein P174DRAFT_453491 [Aspergillus novofumigatus IBT 16806]|uniref:Uncharacterized protein n=1 Tax=Aspergillus novofumigatus (strain IBT 16806) TaxID=1392255 RepID=A0A2I1BYV5_ASPN1|nr:uncharacterized protein P174DRAFT_453491 [Aspergillus novofumigatus IBT 16806]PKX90534.1 hypothetical protein P174DRAFT_453491 [Aspergillus novofumigatus IBT 16806]